jgi:hypothetical protein
VKPAGQIPEAAESQCLHGLISSLFASPYRDIPLAGPGVRVNDPFLLFERIEVRELALNRQ